MTCGHDTYWKSDCIMARITVESNPNPEKIANMGVKSWSTWGCEVSKFDWEYDEEEICYILDGEVTVTTDEETVTIKAGNLVTFPKGLKCTWDVKKAINKHYTFK